MEMVQTHVALLLSLWPLEVLGRCIFDEVQSSVKVLSSPISEPNSSDQTANEVNVKEDGLIQFQTSQNHQGAISQHSQSHRVKRMDIVHPQPIRIKTWTSTEGPNITYWEKERVEAASGEAINTVSKLLSVMRVPERLLLNRDINKYCRFIWRNSSTANFNKCGKSSEKYRTETCLGVTIPDDHLNGYVVYPHPDQPNLRVVKPDGPGIPDTDFVLYVHAQNTDKCRADSSILAYSAHCQTDANGRPVAGVMVICREPLGTKKFSHDRMVKTVIHELFHMLGFSKELYSTWRDCSPSSHGTGCYSRGHVTNTDETGQTRLYTPNVINALHTHLNSTHTEQGAPLENQDAGVGGVSSHWEARVLQGSIMTSTLIDPSVVLIDVLTLSALQDTGWYSVNLNRAQSLLWGESEGALFGSLSTCNKSSSFFCTGSGLGCHYFHLHKGACQSDEYLDGCRMYKPLANASECWKEENERGSKMEKWSGEIYHSDSRCFLSSLVREDHPSISISVAGRCYRHRCTGWNMYQMQVKGSDWLDCPAGRNIKVDGYRGAVFCPDRRLCLYHDLLPPLSTYKPFLSAQLSTVSSSTERDHIPTSSQSSLNFSTSVFIAEKIVIPVLGVTSVLFLMAVFIVFYRKWHSASVRVHSVTEPPHVQLQETRHQR